MTFEEKIRIVDRIVSGVKIVSDRGHIYCVRDPSSFHRQLADIYYDEQYDKLVNDGIMTEEQSKVEIRHKFLWTNADLKQFTKIEGDIDSLKEKLLSLEFKSNERNHTIKSITALEEEKRKLDSRKQALQTYTAEHLAAFAKLRFLVFHLTYNLNEERVWKDWSVFDETNDILISKLVRETFLDERITEKNIREIARSDPWRSAWIAAAKTGNLLNRPIAEITDYQRILVSWSLIYDSVYESMEPPSDEVINDDLLLDSWLMNQQKKRKTPSKKFDDAKGNEIFIPVDSVEDAQKVYKMNDQEAMRIINRRENAINKRESLTAEELPDHKAQLREKKFQAWNEHMKRTGK